MEPELEVDQHYRAAAHPTDVATAQTVKLGCNATPQWLLNRLPRLEAFLGADLPPLPASTDRMSAVTRPWEMLGNDREGDCFFAMCSHMELLTSTVAEQNGQMLSEAETLRRYHDCTGGDNGTDPVQGMNYWQQVGMLQKILGWAKVSLSSADTIKQAINLFGCIGWGMNLPKAWQGQKVWRGPTGPVPRTGPWAPGSWSPSGFAGHIVPLFDFTAAGTFKGVSWGDVFETTLYGIQDYGMIGLVPITPLWIDDLSGLTPGQFRLADLQYQLAVLAGGPLPPKPAPVPTPPPAPAPPPAPPAPPTINYSLSEWLAKTVLESNGHKVEQPVGYRGAWK